MFSADVVGTFLGEGLVVKVAGKALEGVRGLTAFKEGLPNLPNFRAWSSFQGMFNEQYVTRGYAKQLWAIYQHNPQKLADYRIAHYVLRQEGFTRPSIRERLFYGYFKTSGESYTERSSQFIAECAMEIASPTSPEVPPYIYNTTFNALGTAVGKFVSVVRRY